MSKSEKPQKKQPEKPKSNGPKLPPQKKIPRPQYSWVMFVVLAVMAFMLLSRNHKPAEAITFSEFRQRVINQQVQKVIISDSAITGEMRSEALEGLAKDTAGRFEVTLLNGMGEQEDLRKFLDENNTEYAFEQTGMFYNILLSFIPWILILGLMYFFIFRQFRGAGGGGMLGNFGRSKHRLSNKDQASVTFDNVAGIEEAKEEVSEIIQFLRNPKKFQRLGGRIPRGVLLVGEPGCGKTLLAKAIAGEADVPFLSISGSDFVEMFVGVGASRVRDLFKEAKTNSPCIIFLDEIDAVGRKRGAGIAGGGHDEREQTLNAILVEMDGFATDDQVIVIAATNRADVLDNALTRPGRFDRQIYVPLPDIKGRLAILEVHAKKVKMAPGIDLQRLARGTATFSGADLEAIINEAALAATMSNKDFVEMVDLEEARDKVRWGRARRSRVVDDKDKDITAYHEAGHAIVQSIIEDADPVHKVSIIPRGPMGGATFSLPEKDRMHYSKKFCLSMIRIYLGGRVAEEIFCDDITGGAQSDIAGATQLARSMIMEWGMSDKLGFIRYSSNGMNPFGELPGSREYSETTAQEIDREIKQMMDQAYHEVKQILLEHKTQVEALRSALIKYETIDGEDVKRILDGEIIDKPTVNELLEAEQQRSPELDTPSEKNELDKQEGN